MNIRGLMKRAQPLILKFSGQLPFCPWSSVLSSVDPRTLGAHPPAMNIKVIAEEGDIKKLQFDGRQDMWFPGHTTADLQLWGEYLSVFWEHPANGHYYLSHGTGISPGDVCIDCGCCEGTFAVQALAAGAGKVVCIEPNPYMIRCLEKTFAGEIKSGRVVIRQAALAAFCGSAAFSFNAAYPSFGQLGGKEAKEDLSVQVEVPVETIDHICDALGLNRVIFIKMDIEGAEIQAVEGARGVLTKHHPKLALTTYHRQYDFQCLQAILSSLNYKSIRATGLTAFGGQPFRPIMLHGL